VVKSYYCYTSPSTAATFQVLVANKHDAQMQYHNELLKQTRYYIVSLQYLLQHLIRFILYKLSNRKAMLAAEAGGLGKISQFSPQLAQAKVRM
jgi:hypothetical protein